MSKKWLYVILGLSVAINIFVLGVVLGQIKFARDFMAARDMRPQVSLRQLAANMNPQSKKVIRQKVRERGRDLRPKIREVAILMKEVRDLVSAPVPNMLAIRSKLDALKLLSSDIRSVPQDIFIEMLPDLDQETRRRIAKSLFNPQRHQLGRALGIPRHKNQPLSPNHTQKKPLNKGKPDEEPSSL